MCPDRESNRRPFSLQADIRSTESHQPGQCIILKIIHFYLLLENVHINSQFLFFLKWRFCDFWRKSDPTSKLYGAWHRLCLHWSWQASCLLSGTDLTSDQRAFVRMLDLSTRCVYNFFSHCNTPGVLSLLTKMCRAVHERNFFSYKKVWFAWINSSIQVIYSDIIYMLLFLFCYLIWTCNSLGNLDQKVRLKCYCTTDKMMYSSMGHWDRHSYHQIFMVFFPSCCHGDQEPN